MTRSPGMIILVVAAVCAACALFTANIIFGNLNQDEGWYIYAAHMISMGKLPYLDFAYPQMPVMPFVYSLIQPFVQVWGLAAARIFTALIGIAGAVAASVLASRLVGSGQRAAAAILTFILIILNVYQTYFLSVVKTYALTALFLLCGFFVLSAALERRSRIAAVLSGALLTLAACTRSSAIVVLPIVFVGLCFQQNSRTFRGWLYFGLGGVLIASVIVLPFFIIAPENFWFFTVKYHAARQSGSILQALAYKAGFLSRMTQAYFVAVAIWISIVIGNWLNRRNAKQVTQNSSSDIRPFMTKLVWASVIAVTVTHLSAPFPYDDYQVFIYPLFGVAVSTMAVRFIARINSSFTFRLLIVIFLVSVAAAVSSPINQDWFLQGRDRIWWRLKNQTSLGKLRQAGKILRSMSRPGDMLLTQDPYLAVESDLLLPSGMEMGQFCYFPDLSSEQAERLHVLNQELLKKLLRTCEAPVAALSGYAFAIEAPHIKPVSMHDQSAFWEIIKQRYKLVCELPDFGQAFTTLRILKKKHSAESADKTFL